VALLSQLIAVSSPLGESAEPAQRAVAAYLDARGYTSDLVTDDPTAYTSHPDYMAPATPYPAPAVNLVARAAARPSRVGLFAHIDTERAGSGWTTPPLEARVRDGRLYGLGAADDKGGVAAMAVAATILQAQGRPAPIVMSLHGKGGGSRGSLPTFARLKDFSQVLYVHPAETGRGFADIKHIVRGVLDMRLTVTGWRGNARELGSPDSASFSEGGDALQAALAIIDDWRGGTLKGCEVNVGELGAGDRVGSVPARRGPAARALRRRQIVRRDPGGGPPRCGTGGGRARPRRSAYHRDARTRRTRRQSRRGAVGLAGVPGAAHVDCGRHRHGAGLVSHPLRGRHPVSDPTGGRAVVRHGIARRRVLRHRRMGGHRRPRGLVAVMLCRPLGAS
jgi:hypothetical protein